MELDDNTEENENPLDQYGNWIQDKPDDLPVEQDDNTQDGMFSIPDDSGSLSSHESHDEGLFNIQIPDINVPDLDNLDISAIVAEAEAAVPDAAMMQTADSQEDQIIPDENDFSEISLDDFLTGDSNSSTESFDEISLDDFMDDGGGGDSSASAAKKADDEFFQNYDVLDIDLVFDEAYLAETEARKSSNIEDSNFNQFFSDDFGVEFIDESGSSGSSFFPDEAGDVLDLDAIPDMAEEIPADVTQSEDVTNIPDIETIDIDSDIPVIDEPIGYRSDSSDSTLTARAKSDTIGEAATEFDDFLNELNSEPAGGGSVAAEIVAASRTKERVITLTVSEEDLAGTTVQTVQTVSSSASADDEISVSLYPKGYLPTQTQSDVRAQTTSAITTDFDLSEIEGFEFLDDIKVEEPPAASAAPETLSVPEPEKVVVDDIPLEIELDSEQDIPYEKAPEIIEPQSNIVTEAFLTPDADDIPLEEPETDASSEENPFFFERKNMQDDIVSEYTESTYHETNTSLELPNQCGNETDILNDCTREKDADNEGTTMKENESTIFDDTESDMLPDFTVFTDDETNGAEQSAIDGVTSNDDDNTVTVPVDDFSESGITIKEPVEDVPDDYTESGAATSEYVAENNSEQENEMSMEFDDISAVINDFTDNEEEPRDTDFDNNAEKPNNTADSSSQDQSEVLQKIASELSMIKAELATLKNQIVPSVPVSEQPSTDSHEQDSGFFADDDADEPIALTGDELNNILITADFTEEDASESDHKDDDINFSGDVTLDTAAADDTVATDIAHTDAAADDSAPLTADDSAESESTFTDETIEVTNDSDNAADDDIVIAEEPVIDGSVSLEDNDLTLDIPDFDTSSLDAAADDTLTTDAAADDFAPLTADDSAESESTFTDETIEVTNDSDNAAADDIVIPEEPVIDDSVSLENNDLTLDIPDFDTSSLDTAAADDTLTIDAAADDFAPLTADDSAESESTFTDETIEVTNDSDNAAADDIVIPEEPVIDDSVSLEDNDLTLDIPDFDTSSLDTAAADDTLTIDAAADEPADSFDTELNIDDIEPSHITQVDDTGYLDNDDVSGIDSIDQVAIDEPEIPGMDFDTESLEEPELDDLTLDFSDINQELPQEMTLDVAPETDDTDTGDITFDDMADIAPNPDDGIDLADTETQQIESSDDEKTFVPAENTADTDQLADDTAAEDGTENESIITVQNLLDEEVPADESHAESSAFDEFPALKPIVLDDVPSSEPEQQQQPAEEVVTETSETAAAPKPSAEVIPSNLKDDIRSVLLYMDQLLDCLPEDKIEEFAKSEHFSVYKKLLDELELS